MYQGNEENHSAILQSLLEALMNSVLLSPDSIEEQTTLRNKFEIQSTLDIRRKLSKKTFGPDCSLDSLFKLATEITYN